MRKLKSENINNILFMDIETAPNWEHLKDAPDFIKKEWIQKFKYREGAPLFPDVQENANYNDPVYLKKYNLYFEQLWKKSAGIYPEFSRVVCVSMGFMNGADLRIKSYIDKDEGVLLDSFCKDLASFQAVNKYAKLCAHYGKGFDFPYIGKRLLIHRKDLPFILDTYGLKPWEMESLIDTQDVWKMGGYGNGGTLGSIAMSLGIQSPKDDIDGGDVSRCYHNGEINRIAVYCEKDVLTLVNVVKAIRGEKLIE
jgi:predicted PolB exonuclease-like 3'-5' exonuclease